MELFSCDLRIRLNSSSIYLPIEFDLATPDIIYSLLMFSCGTVPITLLFPPALVVAAAAAAAAPEMGGLYDTLLETLFLTER